MEAFNSISMTSLPFAYTFTSGGEGSSNSSSVMINPNYMDIRIWSRLPQWLIDRVITFLPPPAFFRARAVCKRWYALLFSNTFLQLYMQVSPHLHWFLFFKQKTLKTHIYNNNNNKTTTNCEGYLFDPYEICWYRISFGLVPSGFSPVSSSGGVVCWISDDAGAKTLIICNPLIGTLTQLPPTLRPRLFPSIGLNVTATSIDVVVAGDDLISPFAVKNLSTESFHIDAGGFYSLWGTDSCLPRLCSLESGQMVYVNGKFYCMNYSPFSVLSYDVPSNGWLKIQAPMRRFLRSPSLVESRGRLVLVAAVEKSKLNVPKSLRLWGLQGCGTTWVEIERMPQQLYAQLSQVENGLGFDCVGHGEFIVIMVRGASDKALLFDVCRKRWQWIPPCPYVEHGEGVNGFGYEPRLATPVTALLDHLTLPSFHSSFTA